MITRFIKKIAIIALTFVAIVCMLELIYRLLKIPKISHFKVLAKSQELIPQINKHTILIVGDSKLEWGINPPAVFDKFKKIDDSVNVVDMAMPGSNGSDVLKYLLQNNIYPKLILLGYAPNYGGYINHGFDKQIYSKKNKLTEELSYFMDQHFYFRDKSVIEYIKHGLPYFKSHQYDAMGGAIVTANGDYNKRLNTEIDMYRGFKNSFKQANLDKYCTETNEMLDVFKKKGTIICGIYMPVSTTIYTIQNSVITKKDIPINYSKLYDFSSFTYTSESPKPDSSFFYDGCHLLHEYSLLFTDKLINNIIIDFPELNKKNKGNIN